jgi:hypothetical protein
LSYASGGPLSIKFNELILKAYNEKLLQLAEEKNGGFFLTAGLWITDKEYELYKKEQELLEDKYINISLKNRKSKNKDAYRISVLIGAIPKWEPSVFTEIKKDF